MTHGEIEKALRGLAQRKEFRSAPAHMLSIREIVSRTACSYMQIFRMVERSGAKGQRFQCRVSQRPAQHYDIRKLK